MDKVAFFRIQCLLYRKNREIFKTFSNNLVGPKIRVQPHLIKSLAHFSGFYIALLTNILNYGLPRYLCCSPCERVLFVYFVLLGVAWRYGLMLFDGSGAHFFVYSDPIIAQQTTKRIGKADS